MKQVEDTVRFLVNKIQNEKIFNFKEFISAMESTFQESGFRDEPAKGEQKNILVIRLDGIGDNILNSSFLRELRRNYPAAHITLIVNPTVFNLVELCPYVNEVLKFACNPNLLLWFNEAIKLCQEKLWQRHFDICFNLRWDIDYTYTILLGFISGSKERIGYGTKVFPIKEKINAGYDLFLTKPILNPANIIHETSRNLFMLESLGLNVSDTKNEVWYSHKDILNINKLLNDNAPEWGGATERHLISVCNGSMGLSKIYPVELLAQALKLIAAKSDFNFVYFGGKEVQEWGNYLKQVLGNRLISLADKTTLRETCAAVAKTSMYIGSDTGTMHIAAALKVPVIMLSKDAEDCKLNYMSPNLRFTPWQTPTKILQPQHALKPCCDLNPRTGCIANNPHCITQITPQNIADAFEFMKKITYNSN